MEWVSATRAYNFIDLKFLFKKLKLNKGKTKMFQCPECNTNLPKSKAITLSQSSKLECPKCKSVLSPNAKTLRLITFAGAISILMGSSIVSKTAGLYGIIAVIITGGLLTVLAVIGLVKFDVYKSKRRKLK